MQALHTPWSLLATHPWTTAIKLLTKSHRVGTHSFSGHKPAVSPFAWQSNKAILWQDRELHPVLCLQDLIQHQCTEAEFSASNLAPNMGLTCGQPHGGVPWLDRTLQGFLHISLFQESKGLENSFKGQITWDPCLERPSPSHTHSTTPAAGTPRQEQMEEEGPSQQLLRPSSSQQHSSLLPAHDGLNVLL